MGTKQKTKVLNEKFSNAQSDRIRLEIELRQAADVVARQTNDCEPSVPTEDEKTLQGGDGNKHVASDDLCDLERVDHMACENRDHHEGHVESHSPERHLNGDDLSVAESH